MKLFFLCALCLTLVLGTSSTEDAGPQGPNRSGPLSAVIIPRVGHSRGPPEPPGVAPPLPIEEPVPPFSGLGDRCPFPPNEHGVWPGYCYNVIGDNCECLMDDVVVPQKECVLNNRTFYEELVRVQLDLEQEKSNKMTEMRMPTSGERFESVLTCLDNVDAIEEESKLSNSTSDTNATTIIDESSSQTNTSDITEV